MNVKESQKNDTKQDDSDDEGRSYKDALDQLEQDVESKDAIEEAKNSLAEGMQREHEPTEKTIDNNDVKSNADIDSKDQETQLNDANDDKESMGKLGEIGPDDEILKKTLSPQNIQKSIRLILKNEEMATKGEYTSSHKKSISQTTTGANEKASMNEQNTVADEP